mmetsp:Transcript_50580/g.99518  ORF Transcript_50580/g.99518 Transcript_50580/m.99518 type:complete len:104 (-) Transcript_50580:919-1230(-)
MEKDDDDSPTSESFLCVAQSTDRHNIAVAMFMRMSDQDSFVYEDGRNDRSNGCEVTNQNGEGGLSFINQTHRQTNSVSKEHEKRALDKSRPIRISGTLVGCGQ